MLPDLLTFHSAGPLVDIGANLAHESYADDLQPVLERAACAGVSAIILTGADETSVERNVAIVERHGRNERLPLLRTTAGVHPHEADQWSLATERLMRDVLQRDDTTAVGECGLDYFRDFTPRDQQRRAFEAQLALAAEFKLPLFLHERDASADMLDILSQWRDQLGQAVVHCFTGDRKTLYGYLDLDMHIGITGWICDERRGQHLQPLVKEIPSHRLMIETDCPYLLPRDLPASPKARRHEPALLPWISRTIARLTNISEAELAQRTTKTAATFFSLPEQALHLPALARISQEH